MNKKTILAALAAAVITSFPLQATSDGLPGPASKEFKEAIRLYDRGMVNRSSIIFDRLARAEADADAEGYAVMADVVAGTPGYVSLMEAYLAKRPHTSLAFRMKYQHAMNLFEAENYLEAGKILSDMDRGRIEKGQIDEYIFKTAFCALENGDKALAEELFYEIDIRPVSDYTAPSRFVLGYLAYDAKDFRKAIDWLDEASVDSRFKKMAEYYIFESRFMLKDHEYVVANGDSMYEAVPQERKSHLARIISESCLVLGDVDKARTYYELAGSGTDTGNTRSDWFYSGSVLYAVDDYEGAIKNYSNMTDRTDSLGQIANYHLGYSYIQTKNKVAALDAFKDAAIVMHDPELTEDAFFNWAKLAFDLNDDTSVFNAYIDAYPAKEQEQRINSYIAVAALHDRDYEAAVNAYDKIDELDDYMVLNYMKANYLRANQLIKNGSYRLAIPCLKAAAYYSDRSSRFNQLSRYWLAESYYRNEQYKDALTTYTELYNISALYGQEEHDLLPYNIAYCYFVSEDYPSALKWFGEYLNDPYATYRKEALVRSADCYFVDKDYNKAVKMYEDVIKGYADSTDMYPVYQAAVAYGLLKKPAKKIELLSSVRKASPDAAFYAECLYELGRAYVARYEDDKALECFKLLADNVKDATYVARAYLEMGSLARNQSQYNEALKYYKTVVEDMPMSGYAEDALAAIEAIYQIRNKPKEYIAYIEKIGKGNSKTADEKEDMIFNSAEQIFLSENYQKALVALDSYLEQYPDGRNAYKADFYKAESYRMLEKYEQACDCYRKVIEGGEGSFVELSMLNFSDISFRLERWEDAYGGYSSLYSAALIENNKSTALTGMMRSAYRGHDWGEAIKNADKVMFDSRATPAVHSEAQYIKAKSYLASSRRDEAFAILGKLAEDVSGQYGAEAAYLLILDSYDRGEFEDVENKVFAFSDAGSPQVYWLAKSFIVLGDSFVERDELVQAKATFESVRDGYEPQNADDDVKDNVELRLKKLEEMMVSE
ncbi:MAG: tetratricopeptide repeat protein [Bacteroidales bacterium]|nr:tetratricopeptide repeat protein [Bacteroidales bacterium]